MARLSQIFKFLFAVLATFLCVLFGLFALLPSLPFKVQNKEIGTILIILSFCGIVALVGAILGWAFGRCLEKNCLVVDEAHSSSNANHSSSMDEEFSIRSGRAFIRMES